MPYERVLVPATAVISVRKLGEHLVQIVADTSTYRRLSEAILSCDRVLEIGCSWGHCTELLAARASSVVALDCSRECVKTASAKLPGVRFERVDLLATPALLATLTCAPWPADSGEDTCASVAGSMDLRHLIGIGLVPAAIRNPVGPSGREHQGFTCVFVDIGGVRCIEDVVSVLALVEMSLAPEHIVVKSERLAESLKTYTDTWWAGLLSTRSDLSRQKGSRRKVRHPLDDVLRTPQRETPEGRAICRFANYGICHKGQLCSFDHSHCHSCLQIGHLASVCPHGTEEGLIKA